MASWRRAPVLSLIHRRARTVAHRAFSELVMSRDSTYNWRAPSLSLFGSGAHLQVASALPLSLDTASHLNPSWYMVPCTCTWYHVPTRTTFHQQAHRPLPSSMPLSGFSFHCSDVLGKGAQAPCASLLSHAMPLPVFFTLKICLHSFMLLRYWLSRAVRWDALLRYRYRCHNSPAPSHTPFNPPAFV